MSKTEYYRIRKKLEKGNWKDIERKGNWKDIERKSTRPKHIRKSKLLNLTELEEKVLEIRKENPNYGKRKIHKIIIRDYFHHLHISASAIGRILKRLCLLGLIIMKSSKIKRKLKKDSATKPRNFEGKHAKAWNYEERHISNLKNVKHDNIDELNIRELIRIDHIKLNINGLRFIEFSAIDPINKIQSILLL